MEEKENPCVTDGMLDIVSYDVLGKLPDPFRFDDGRRVAGQADWAARRRELYKTAVELQYGVMPPENEWLEVEPLYISPCTKVYRIKAGPRAHPVSFRMKLLLPRNVENPPVIVDGDLCFNYAMDRAWLDAALDNGIAWALFDRTELACDIPDDRGRAKGPFFEAYGGLPMRRHRRLGVGVFARRRRARAPVADRRRLYRLYGAFPRRQDVRAGRGCWTSGRPSSTPMKPAPAPVRATGRISERATAAGKKLLRSETRGICGTLSASGWALCWDSTRNARRRCRLTAIISKR